MDVIAVEDDMTEQLDLRQACQQVRESVKNCLPERERMIIALRYGLDGREPLTQREVAKQCGISRSYVSRIEKRALQRLREELKEWES